MPTLSIPIGDSFTIINPTAIVYNGDQYHVTGPLSYPAGLYQSLPELITAAGARAYSFNELKRCFKIEGYDQSANGQSWFSLYTSNSKQTLKNDSAKIPGGMWAEFFDFLGSPRVADGGYDNAVLALWVANGKTPADWSTSWIGFRLAYGTSDTRSYTMTYQDDFLQESLPTPPVVVDGTFMHSVKLHGVFHVDQQDPGGHHYVPIRKIHLWRTTTGVDGSTVYRRVPVDAVSDGFNELGVLLEFNHDPGKFTQQIPDPTLSYGYQLHDIYRDEELLDETLPSADWDPPPFREALQLVGLWNGMMCIHVGNTVMFCEPFRPHAWPSKYRYPLPFEIVSKEVDGNTLIVTTTGPAFLFTGAHPSGMSYEPLQNTQAGKKSELIVGLSRAPSRAICRTPLGVCYATDDGLVVSGGGRSRLLTDKLFTKDEWKARYGPLFGRMRLAYANGHVLCWFNRTNEIGFIMDLAGTSLTEWQANPVVGVASQQPGSEGLYFVAGPGVAADATLQRFEDPSTSRMVATWLSRKAILPRPMNFGCFQVVGSGQINVRISAGNRGIIMNISFTLTNGVPRIWRLPHGFREREWTAEFQLTADAIIREFYLAGTPDELRGA